MDKGNRETWRPVVEYEGSYDVSDEGRVRSLPRTTPHGKTLRGRYPVGSRTRRRATCK
ncbi:NUMOD4 domain-containing protein [Pseudoclavibacter helvolus]